ncbi:MAG: beta-L-arabinofuranosidase domain-containing protein, partial [Terracidiphilus sp.]
LATRDYYYGIPDDDILKGYRRRRGMPSPGRDLGGWCEPDASMVFGQWLSGMARIYKATGDTAMRDKGVYLMQEWAKTVGPDEVPYLADGGKQLQYSHYQWDKLVCGLLDMYEYGGEKDALSLLEAVTDWGSKHLDRTRSEPAGFDISGFPPEWYTLSENLYRAYQVSGDPKFKTFGDEWRDEKYWGMFSGTGQINLQGFHAYSHVNSLSSAAMTYAVTQDPKYLRSIIGAYDHFQDFQCYATGGYGPAERLVAAGDGALGRSLEREANTFETPCGSWAVFKLGRYLIQFTGEARFGDWIERLLYNGIGAALPMGQQGKTFYYSDYRLSAAETIGSARKIYYWDSYPCCSGTYIQDVADYHNLIYFKDAQSLYINLFVPSEVVWRRASGNVLLRQETSYPDEDTSRFSLALTRSERFRLCIRIPSWAEKIIIRVNGTETIAPVQAGWATIERLWQDGDKITAQIPMLLRSVSVDEQHPNRVAIVYGPVVLVQNGQYTLPFTGAALQAGASGVLVPTGMPLEFQIAAAAPKGVFAPAWGIFAPFYRVGHEIPYRMYFDLDERSDVGVSRP